jgi:hypothetical protein
VFLPDLAAAPRGLDGAEVEAGAGLAKADKHRSGKLLHNPREC